MSSARISAVTRQPDGSAYFTVSDDKGVILSCTFDTPAEAEAARAALAKGRIIPVR